LAHGNGHKEEPAAGATLVRSELPEGPGHPFYRRLNELLEHAQFDGLCEQHCRRFYHEKLGRPSLSPGMYA